MQKKHFSNTSLFLNRAGHHEKQNWQPQGDPVGMQWSACTMLIRPCRRFWK